MRPSCVLMRGGVLDVQAISFLRQKKLDEVAASLNNLVACEKVLPSEAPVTWEQRAELQDLYSTYLTRVRTHPPPPPYYN